MKNITLISSICLYFLINLVPLNANTSLSPDMQQQMKYFSYEQAHNKLKSINQEQLLDTWHLLEERQKQTLLKAIEQIDCDALLTQKKALLSNHFSCQEDYEPFSQWSNADTLTNSEVGKRLIANGKVGCLIVAGGQGTRLGFHGPKGMFPVSVVKGKTLFQIFSEKVLAAGKQANSALPLAIMTSPQNHEQTVNFFRQHNNFGLDKDQIDFFCQKDLPLLDDHGNLLLEMSGNIALGPNGNGTAFEYFITEGIWKKWYAKGIEYMTFILVDNPLADPFNAELIGLHDRNKCDITVQCVEKNSPDEKVGLLVQSKQGVKVVEYSEITDVDREALMPDGSLKHKCANIGIFCFSMDFIQRTFNTAPLSWHFASKDTKVLDSEGKEKTVKAWKFEKFIFDILPQAEQLTALLCQRENCFAPLKNQSGANSIDTVQKALLQKDKATFYQVTGTHVDHEKFELSQEFYYPTPQLLENWKEHIFFEKT